MNVTVVDRAFRHHGAHSGYQQVSRYVGALPAGHVGLLRFVPETLVHRLPGMSPTWYDRRSLETELTLLPHLARRRRRVFHFLYGEHSFRLSGAVTRALRSSHGLVATYHQVPAFLARRAQILSSAAGLGGVVVVASNQAGCFDGFVRREMIHLIPHGVDAAFFRPASDPCTERDGFRILTVGSNYRDFASHVAVIRALNRWNPRVRYTIIGGADCEHYYREFANVEYCWQVSDEQLRAQYQESDLLLLPLADATASNALLEAMACGLPAVVSAVGGVKDYADGSCAALIERADAGLMAEAVIGLLTDGRRRAELARSARERAVTVFAWPRIAERLRALYGAVAN